MSGSRMAAEMEKKAREISANLSSRARASDRKDTVSAVNSRIVLPLSPGNDKIRLV